MLSPMQDKIEILRRRVSNKTGMSSSSTYNGQKHTPSDPNHTDQLNHGSHSTDLQRPGSHYAKCLQTESRPRGQYCENTLVRLL